MVLGGALILSKEIQVHQFGVFRFLGQGHQCGGAAIMQAVVGQGQYQKKLEKVANNRDIEH
jgi:hypothetical protein